jgi:KaiC/GvpD/RAD55 family RecA-like ATPase
MTEAPDTHHSDADEAVVTTSTATKATATATAEEKDTKRKREGPGRCRLVMDSIVELVTMLEDNRLASLEEFWRQVNRVHVKYFTTCIETPNHPDRKRVTMLLEEGLTRVDDAYKTGKLRKLAGVMRRYVTSSDNPFTDDDATDNDDTTTAGGGSGSGATPTKKAAAKKHKKGDE